MVGGKITCINYTKPTDQMVDHHDREDSRNYYRRKNGGETTRGRPRIMLLDWIMKEGYRKLTERTGQHVKWRHWMYETA